MASQGEQSDTTHEQRQPESNVEMKDLASQSQRLETNLAAAEEGEEEGTASASPAAASTALPSTSTAQDAQSASQPQQKQQQPSTDSSQAIQPTKTTPADANNDDTEAIGPSATNITTASKIDASAGPALHITLLLTSGARHPWMIDQKYLRKRSVDVEGDDPYNISVYTLKELIWRDWRSEWEPRPSNPSYIRLISFGRMLEDKLPLKECRFNNESPNIVHMTVKPQEIIDEEETAKGGKGRGGDGEDRDAGCRCVIL